MQIIKYFWVLFILVMPLSAYSQYKLTIEVVELKNNSGKVNVQLFDEKENEIAKQSANINNKKSVIVFDNLKPAKYAVRYFHDENSNGILDKNFLGIPSEGYGFSNNVKGLFGPPSFKKWLFELKNNMTITLKPNY